MLYRDAYRIEKKQREELEAKLQAALDKVQIQSQMIAELESKVEELRDEIENWEFLG